MLVRVVAQGKLRAMGALGPPRRSNENERGGGGGGGGGVVEPFYKSVRKLKGPHW